MMYRCDICPDDDPYTSEERADVARHLKQSTKNGHENATGNEISLVGVVRTVPMDLDVVVDILHSDIARQTRKDIVESLVDVRPEDRGLETLFNDE